MTEQAPPWPKQGPPSYFPSIEKKYGRSIAEWQQVIASCGLDKHMAIVGYLKSEHGMGHGHANALVRTVLTYVSLSTVISCHPVMRACPAVRCRGPARICPRHGLG